MKVLILIIVVLVFVSGTTYVIADEGDDHAGEDGHVEGEAHDELALFVFGFGLGVPIIPLCAVTSSVRGKLGNKYVIAGKWMQRIFGIIIIVI
jgi:hypothetical protein